MKTSVMKIGAMKTIAMSDFRLRRNTYAGR